jgi:uncharacterized protein (TIGR02145 family)
LPSGLDGQILKFKGGIPVWVNDNFYCGLTLISDYDENKYKTVQIGTQCWMAENLRVRKYNDGTNIPFDKSGGPDGNGSGQTWGALTYGAHTLYRYDSTANTGNLANYGYLYNWYAAAGIITAGASPTKNICPFGWRVPTNGDWNILTSFLGGTGEGGAGGNLKSQSNFWENPNTGANNSSGFSALPGGYRETNGLFKNLRTNAWFYTSTENGNAGWYRNLFSSTSSVNVNNIYDSNKTVGASIRCLKE